MSRPIPALIGADFSKCLEIEPDRLRRSIQASNIQASPRAVRWIRPSSSIPQSARSSI